MAKHYAQSSTKLNELVNPFDTNHKTILMEEDNENIR